MTAADAIIRQSLRLFAAFLGLLAGLLVAAAAFLTPLVLERWVLVDGRIETGHARLGFYGLAILHFMGGLLMAEAARRTWRRASQFEPRRVWFALMAVALMVVILLIPAELVVRSVIPIEDCLVGDSFWKYRWALLRTDPEGSRDVLRGAVDRHDPELGWTPTPGFRSDGINVNSAGFRGLREYSFEKPRGMRRIVVIGDSFTFGEDVRDEEVYPAILELLVENVEVINLGVRGYGTDQQYLRLKRVGADYDPDLIVLGVYTLNVDRNVLSFRDYAKPVFRMAQGRLTCTNIPIPAPGDAGDRFRPDLPPVRLIAMANKVWNNFVTRTWLDSKWAITEELLDAVQEFTRERGIPLLVVHIPANRGIRDTAVFLQAWAARQPVPFLDLYSVFDELPPDQRSRLYAGHWTPFGHEVAAGALRDFIAKNKLLIAP